MDVERRRIRGGGRGSRCLVTGGAGFIGSHLVDRLLTEGHHVTVVDDLSTSRLDNLPLHHAALRVVEAHVGDAADLVDQLVREADLVCHLAGAVGPRRAQQEPFQTADNILRAGLEVTGACGAWRRPLLFLSSAEVYGGGRLEVSEADELLLGTHPRLGHAAAKLAVEHLVLGLHRSFGVPSWVVRPFDVVGPRQSPRSGHLLPCFLQAALRGSDLVVRGDGSQRGTFLHVADLVAAVYAVLGAPALVGQPVNVGGQEVCSVADLARLVIRTVGGPARLRHVGHERGGGPGVIDPPDEQGSVELLRSTTGWAPERTLEDAVRDAAAWWRPRITSAGVAQAPPPERAVAATA